MSNEDAEQLILLAVRLGRMLEVGTPVLRALDTCVDAMPTEKFQKAVLDVREKASNGYSLTSAFSAYPETFPSFFVEMVRTGEDRGVLDATLLKLSEALHKEQSLRTENQASALRSRRTGQSIEALRRMGLVSLRIEFNRAESRIESDPEDLVHSEPGCEILRAPAAFAEGLFHLLNPSSLGPVMAGTILGTPPFFIQVAGVWQEQGGQWQIRCHAYPEDPLKDSTLRIEPGSQEFLQGCFSSRKGILLADIGQALEHKAVLSWMLLKASAFGHRRCACIEESWNPPVAGISSLRPDSLKRPEGGWDSRVLHELQYEVIGVTGMPTPSLAASLHELVSAGTWIVLGLPGWDHGEDLPLHGDDVLGQVKVVSSEPPGAFHIEMTS